MIECALQVTFILVTYRQERFVQQALESALAQDYGPLQVIISDDCSPDGTFEIIQQMLQGYRGPHEVVAIRNSTNLGLVGNLNAAMTRASGELVVVAAGDDVSYPERTRLICDQYLLSGRMANSIYSNALVLNEDGATEGLYYRWSLPTRVELNQLSKKDAGVLGCTQAWTKNVFDIFGPLDATVQREDAIIPFRAALLGHVAYLDFPLVKYRRHGHNVHFRAAATVEGRSELYSALRLHSEGNVAVVRARLADIAKFRSLGWQHRDLGAAEMASTRLLAEKVLENRLLVEGRVGQVLTILRAIILRVPLRRLIRWGLLAFSPKLYLWYQRRLAPS